MIFHQKNMRPSSSLIAISSPKKRFLNILITVSLTLSVSNVSSGETCTASPIKNS